MSREAEKLAYEEAVAEERRAVAARAQSSSAQESQTNQCWDQAMRQQAIGPVMGNALGDAQNTKRAQEIAYAEKRRLAMLGEGASSQPSYQPAPAPMRVAPALPNQRHQGAPAEYPPQRPPPSLPLAGLRQHGVASQDGSMYAPRLSPRVSPAAPSGNPAAQQQRQDQQSNYAADLRAQMEAKNQRDRMAKFESRQAGSGFIGDSVRGYAPRGGGAPSPYQQQGYGNHPHQRQDQQLSYAADLRAQMDAKAQREQRQRDDLRRDGGGGLMLGQPANSRAAKSPRQPGHERNQRQDQQSSYAADLLAQIDAKTQRDLRERDDLRQGGGGGGLVASLGEPHGRRAAPSPQVPPVGSDRHQRQDQQSSYVADLRAQMNAKAQRDQRQCNDAQGHGGGDGGILVGDPQGYGAQAAPSPQHPGRFGHDRPRQQDPSYAADLRAQMDAKAQRDQKQRDEARGHVDGGVSVRASQGYGTQAAPRPQHPGRFGQDRPRQQDPSYAADLRAQMEEKKRRDTRELEAQKPWLAKQQQQQQQQHQQQFPGQGPDESRFPSGTLPFDRGGSHVDSYPPHLGVTVLAQQFGVTSPEVPTVGRRGRGLAEINETSETLAANARKADAWSKVISDQIEERKKQKELDRQKLIDEEQREEERLERERVKIERDQAEEQQKEKKRAEEEKLKADLVRQIAESKLRAEEERKKEKDLRENVDSTSSPQAQKKTGILPGIQHQQVTLQREPPAYSEPTVFLPLQPGFPDRQDTRPSWPNEDSPLQQQQQHQQHHHHHQHRHQQPLKLEVSRSPRYDHEHIGAQMPAQPPWNNRRDHVEEDAAKVPPFGKTVRRRVEDDYTHREERDHPQPDPRVAASRLDDEKWHLERDVERLRMEAVRLREKTATLRPTAGVGALDEKWRLEMEVERLRLEAARAREEVRAATLDTGDWRDKARFEEKIRLEEEMDRLRTEVNRLNAEASAIRAVRQAEPTVTSPVFNGVEDVGQVWRAPAQTAGAPFSVPEQGAVADSLGYLSQAAQHMQAALLTERRRTRTPGTMDDGELQGTLRGDSELVGFSFGDAGITGSSVPLAQSAAPSDAPTQHESVKADTPDVRANSASLTEELVSETELVSFGAPFTPLPERQRAKLRYNQLQAEVQRRKAQAREGGQLTQPPIEP